MERRSLSILGATGSIGNSTLDLVRHHGDKFDVRVLTAGSNIDRLITLSKEFKPRFVAIADETKIKEFQSVCPDIDIVSVDDAGAIPVDICMAAIVGTAGLTPTMNAIKNGNHVAFASKECLVAAGDLMMQAVANSGAKLLPVDSEHNAIYQVFDEGQKAGISRLILTASGGPFLNTSYDEMTHATPAQAVAHPTWSMGAKISVDSATLMNKALEVIEAHYLFAMPSDKIDVIIHPQSLIHSCVEYVDGSILSQMGPSDMRTPIAYCLGWPDRIQTSGEMLDFTTIPKMTFEKPDTEKFKSLAMVRDVLAEGQGASIIFNASNEIANKSFLDGHIKLTQIYDVVAQSLDQCPRISITTIEDVVALDSQARRIAGQIIERLS
jgi:1-deoxy-D-xylulose-5-phosphate reductoisomerase